MRQSQLAKDFFNSMPEDVFHFFENGQINGGEVVETLGLKKKEVAAVTDINQTQFVMIAKCLRS